MPTCQDRTPQQELEARIWNALQFGSKVLDLSGLGLETLPEYLAALPLLQELHLENNLLTAVPESICFFPHLQKLNLENNQLVLLPESIGRLIQLQELNLVNNQLISLPQSIGRLTQLQALNLGSNKLTVLPESLVHLTQLQVLNLGCNQLTVLPESLGWLTQLKRLDLWKNQLTALPESLDQLMQLKELYLGSNQLIALPEWLGELRKLQQLDLEHNQLTVLPEWLGQLTQLKRLALGGNQLTALPAWMGRLTQLKRLALGGNQLSALPAWLGQLTQLQDLDLGNNQLTALPEWLGRLKKLQRLDLRRNQLRTLPQSLKKMRLSALILYDNPALNLPPEILEPDPQKGVEAADKCAKPAAILEYYFRMRVQARPLNEAKLILVGRGTVGKTSLVNRLLHDAFNARESKTEGIKITPWSIKAGNDYIGLNIWDFGGQEIMHATHQFFLTERSLYLLVLNGREGGEDYDAEYWLKLIASFGGDSPIIIVQNKIDQHPFELDYRGLQAKYPQIRAFVKTDCQTSCGIEALRRHIRDVLARMESIRTPFPASWFAIKNELAVMPADFLSYEAFRKLCRKHNELALQGHDNLATVLHCLGIALNYKDDPRLRDMSVLNPHWVTRGIYAILNARGLVEQHGVMRLHDLDQWLPPEKYPREKHVFIMELMRKFRLCFAFPENAQLRYLVPELLPKEQPDLQGRFQPEDCLNFEYHYDILPEGLLPQFIVRNYVLISGMLHWRSGVVLGREGCFALVKADTADRRVIIRIQDGSLTSRREFLAIVRSDFERIHSEIKYLEVKAKVPLPDCPERVIDYQELRDFENCNESFYPVSIGGEVRKYIIKDLLNGVDLDLQAGKSESAMNKPRWRLFYSYSHKDEALRDQLETHLKLLHREGLIEPWHDRRLVAGEEWDKQINDHLLSADIILLLVSADFIASDYCWDIEVRNALERHHDQKAMVIPIILRDCDWHTAPFGKLQALPKDGKPITIWPDRDTAWKDVAQGIRRAVEYFNK